MKELNASNKQTYTQKINMLHVIIQKARTCQKPAPLWSCSEPQSGITTVHLDKHYPRTGTDLFSASYIHKR
jgi:hypothetical protein